MRGGENAALVVSCARSWFCGEPPVCEPWSPGVCYAVHMMKNVTIIGGGLAGSEAAPYAGGPGFRVRLVEMRPHRGTPFTIREI